MIRFRALLFETSLALTATVGCATMGTFAEIRPERVTSVDGFPFSKAALEARGPTLAMFGAVKRVIPVSIIVRTSLRNPWLHPWVGFTLDARVRDIASRVFALHGLELIKADEVLASSSYRQIEHEALLEARFCRALGLLAEFPGLVLRGALDCEKPAALGIPKDAWNGHLVHEPRSAAESKDRRAALFLRPAEFVASEPEDGFVAQLLGELKGDAALVVDLCVGIDLARSSLGLCGPSTVALYGPRGKLLMTPLLVMRPQPDPTLDELYYDPPAEPELWSASEQAFSAEDLASLREAAQNHRVALRTAYDRAREARKQSGDAAALETWKEDRPRLLSASFRGDERTFAAFDAVVERLIRSVLRQLGRSPTSVAPPATLPSPRP